MNDWGRELCPPTLTLWTVNKRSRLWVSGTFFTRISKNLVLCSFSVDQGKENSVFFLRILVEVHGGNSLQCHGLPFSFGTCREELWNVWSSHKIPLFRITSVYFEMLGLLVGLNKTLCLSPTFLFAALKDPTGRGHSDWGQMGTYKQMPFPQLLLLHTDSRTFIRSRPPRSSPEMRSVSTSVGLFGEKKGSTRARNSNLTSVNFNRRDPAVYL